MSSAFVRGVTVSLDPYPTSVLYIPGLRVSGILTPVFTYTYVYAYGEIYTACVYVGRVRTRIFAYDRVWGVIPGLIRLVILYCSQRTSV